MKKTFITLFFILVILNVYSQVKCIEDATKKVVSQNSSQVLKFIQESSSKKSVKVLVLPFLYNNQADAWSSLIARNMAKEFQTSMQNKTDIIFYDESEFSNMNTQSMAATVNNTDYNYWNNLLEKFKPDFFIQGVYNKTNNSLNQESLELSLISISSYYFDAQTELKKMVISETSIVIPQEDKMQQAKNPLNLWAEGTGTMLLKAEENAINNLIGKVANNFSSAFDPQKAKNIAETYKPDIKSFAKTQILSEEAGDAQVIKYIELEILNRIYNDREIMIKEYLNSGNIAETELRISDALKNYYWALLLLQTHPQNAILRGNIGNQTNVLLLVTLPQKIRDILTSVKYESVRIIDNQNNSKTIELKITYKNQPVQNVEYKYWTGTNYSQIVRAQNGVGTIDLFGAESNNVNDLKIKTEYMFANKIAENAVITEFFNNMDLIQFNESQQNSNTSNANQQKSVQNTDINNNFTKAQDIVVKPDDAQPNQQSGTLINKHDYLGIVKTICEAVSKNDKVTPAKYFTTDGYDMYKKLVEFGQAKVLNWSDNYTIIEINDRIMLRSVTMQFTFSNRTFIERVVFSFNKDGKVEALSFAVSDKTYNDIMNSTWDTFDKYEIIFFIEHYKTAFSLKRLDYLSQIFDENALIIVGHTAQKTQVSPEQRIQIANQNIVYTKYTKQEYMNRLQTVFASNEYIYLNFQETSVKQSKLEHVYGVQLQQDYFSTYYADKGYLFLLIDLRDYKNPLIHVRTWQPEKNQDGSVFGLDDFYFD
jgi:hypothetical protein